jgi:hypothetical protein
VEKKKHAVEIFQGILSCKVVWGAVSF